LNSEASRKVVVGTSGAEAIQKPETLLRIGEAESPLPSHSKQRWNRLPKIAVEGFIDPSSQALDRRSSENLLNRNPAPEGLFQARDHLHRPQRMASKVEETRFGANGFKTKNLSKGRRDPALSESSRSDDLFQVPAISLPRHRQSAKVHFPVGGQRNFFQGDEGRRHHVRR